MSTLSVPIKELLGEEGQKLPDAMLGDRLKLILLFTGLQFTFDIRKIYLSFLKKAKSYTFMSTLSVPIKELLGVEGQKTKLLSYF